MLVCFDRFCIISLSNLWVMNLPQRKGSISRHCWISKTDDETLWKTSSLTFRPQRENHTKIDFYCSQILRGNLKKFKFSVRMRNFWWTRKAKMTRSTWKLPGWLLTPPNTNCCLNAPLQRTLNSIIFQVIHVDCHNYNAPGWRSHFFRPLPFSTLLGKQTRSPIKSAEQFLERYPTFVAP